MKSGQLQTRSRTEYSDEIADQSTTVRITEVGSQLLRVADAVYLSRKSSKAATPIGSEYRR
jgi:hypothetical protein